MRQYTNLTANAAHYIHPCESYAVPLWYGTATINTDTRKTCATPFFFKACKFAHSLASSMLGIRPVGWRGALPFSLHHSVPCLLGFGRLLCIRISKADNGFLSELWPSIYKLWLWRSPTIKNKRPWSLLWSQLHFTFSKGWSLPDLSFLDMDQLILYFPFISPMFCAVRSYGSF